MSKLSLIFSACLLILSIARSEASTVDVSGTYSGGANNGSFTGSFTITGSVFTAGDVLFKATTGTDFGELNVFGSGSSTSIGLGNSGGTLFAGFNLMPPGTTVSDLLAAGSASFSGGIVSVPGETPLANLNGTAMTPIPAALPLFATGIGAIGLIG